MVQTCDQCGRKTSDELWKHSTKNICSRCLQINLLGKTYAIFTPDAREALSPITKEIERLLDKQREEEILPLLKKGLSYINGYLIHSMDLLALEDATHWYNEAMKKAGRFNSSRFIVDRTLLVGNTRFIIVMYLKNGKDPEVWKFFTGQIKKEEA